MTRMMIVVVLCITAVAPGNAVAGDRYAFLVGVRNYDPASFVSLRYTEDDVTGLASALKRSGYDSSNVVLMKQSEGANNFKRLPLSKQIRDELRLLLSELQTDDTLIVAFSGHGVQFEGEDTIYFCPMDATLNDKKSLVSLTEVYGLLADERLCKAGTKVLLVDACRNDPRSENLKKSGGLIELAPAGVGVPPEPPGGVVAFFSCSQNIKGVRPLCLIHRGNGLLDVLEGASWIRD